jgi:hypothetical protein
MTRLGPYLHVSWVDFAKSRDSVNLETNSGRDFQA